MDGLLGLEQAFFHRAIGRGQVLDQEVQEDGFFIGDRMGAKIDVGFEDSRERRGGGRSGSRFPGAGWSGPGGWKFGGICLREATHRRKYDGSE